MLLNNTVKSHLNMGLAAFYMLGESLCAICMILRQYFNKTCDIEQNYV
jgi:hypothetical protein